MQSASSPFAAPGDRQAPHIAFARRQLVLPIWQPDSEVSQCFVCNSQFTLFFRKHHCRRCGRVVCRSCSPHRITMPRQYIVQPPNVTNSSDEEDLQEMFASHQSFGASEEVRVCNPCVPDPNPNPPSSPQPPAYSERATLGDLESRFNAVSMDRIDWLNAGSSRSLRVAARPSGHRTSYSVTDIPRPMQREAVTGLLNRASDASLSGPAQNTAGFPAVTQAHDGQATAYRGSMIPTNMYTSQSNDPSRRAPLQSTTQQLRTPVAEEDECPVCGEELPQRQADDGDSLRKAHIETCLQSHMYSSSAPSESIARLATSLPSQNDASTRTELSNSQAQDAGTHTASTNQPRRMTRGQMLVYLATEKDCVGAESAAQECVICLEDFEVRQEMARLECLCKFHRKCIREWWNTKGVGSCPTHQLHA